MVRKKYIVNLQTSASAMFTSTRVKVTVGVLLVLSLLFSILYLIHSHLQPSSAEASSTSEHQQLNINSKYRQHFVRNLTAELWQRHQSNNNDSHSTLSSLRPTFALLTTLKVMGLDNQFAAAKQTIVQALLGGASEVNQRRWSTTAGAADLRPVELVNEYLASLLSASALEEEEDDGGGSKLLHLATTRLVPLIEQHYQWGDGFVFYETDPQQFLLTSEILAHYPVFNHLSNVTSTRAYRDLVTAFENVFNSILLGRSPSTSSSLGSSDLNQKLLQKLNGILLPLPVDLTARAYRLPVADVDKARKEADVGQLAASLLAVHQQAPNTSLQVGRIEHLFEFITANLTREWKPRSLYVKSFFDYTQEGVGEPSMHFSQCNLGATLALGARQLEDHLFDHLTSMDEKMRAEEVERYQAVAVLGASLVDTCHQAAAKPGSLPSSSDRFYLLPNGSIFQQSDEQHFDLSYSTQQLAEAYFVLHRLTGDQVYREYAWELTQALHRKLSSSTLPLPPPPPQFFSATLKWLYLVQGDQLPLEKWFFTRPAGHPLPVLGSIEWDDDGRGYEEEDGDNGGGRLLIGASFYRPRGGGGGGSRRKGAIIISESPDLN